jgi:hypothetical protein
MVYCGKGENKPRSVIINDQRLAITQNLYSAPLHLQDHSCPRVIWADAICINQGNNREKEHQIPLMPEVYAKAGCVLVWLGEAENGL